MARDLPADDPVEPRGRPPIFHHEARENEAASGLPRDIGRRQAFLTQLRDALRRLEGPEAIKAGAAKMLEDELGASRVGCAEMLERSASLSMTDSEASYPTETDLHLRLIGIGGERGAINDIVGEASLSARERKAFRRLSVAAVAYAPMTSADGGAAVMFAHFSEPHDWTAIELLLLEETAERTGAAIERARARAAARDSEARLAAQRAELESATARQRQLTRELTHRSKNLLTVVQSIANRTLSGDLGIEEARAVFGARLRALANTYAALSETSAGASLRDIIGTELQPWIDRARISGPSISLTLHAAQTLTLVMHELSTNAIKHGALSEPEGTVDVRWKVAGVDGGRRLHFHWRERGGPLVRPRARAGFGSTVLSAVAGAELNCQPTLAFSPDGFEYRFDAPLAAIGLTAE